MVSLKIGRLSLAVFNVSVRVSKQFATCLYIDLKSWLHVRIFLSVYLIRIYTDCRSDNVFCILACPFPKALEKDHARLVTVGPHTFCLVCFFPGHFSQQDSWNTFRIAMSTKHCFIWQGLGHSRGDCTPMHRHINSPKPSPLRWLEFVRLGTVVHTWPAGTGRLSTSD